MRSLSYSGSSKRSKGFDIIHKVVSCLVDGCTSDISQGREYHRRHKVCELHSKMPLVTIGGREQRFCQQCSRFHSLGEFDDGKRSCRKRLDGHNRRRRKPPSTPLSKSPRSFLPNQQGALLSFSTPTPQLPPSPSPTVVPSWAGPIKFDQTNATGPYYSLNNNAIGTMEQYKILGTNKPISEPCFSKPVLGSNNEYNMTRVADSDCALSLLSSATTAESRGIGLGHFLIPNTQYAEVFSSYNARTNIHCQAHGLFSDVSDGPGSSGVYRALTFKWE